MINDKTKKDFQKTIKAIREEKEGSFNGNAMYPKPMMTAVQIEKKQATVNCGGEWVRLETSIRVADYVLADERFNEFLNKYQATAIKEVAPCGKYQIRINF